MNQETQRNLQKIHTLIDRAAQADLRGSVTINFGGENRIVADYKLGLTEDEVEFILAQRIEQKKLRNKQPGKENGF